MKTIPFKNHLAKYHLPIVFITPKNKLNQFEALYPFAIDTSVKHNLIHGCFLKDFEDPVGISFEKAISTNMRYWELATEMGTPFHDDIPYYPYYGVFEDLEEKRIKGKDGVSKNSKLLQFNFLIDDDAFSECFFVDESLCTYSKGKHQVQGILGLDFLKKHKWVIDFEMQYIIINH
jgi:hypothetical protein